jgi:DNA uptake protein ComE-like DNA-binding protein
LRFDSPGPADIHVIQSTATTLEVAHTGFLPDGRIDLNTASLDLLMTLPGVGPATAEEIIAARAERPFTSLADVDDCCALSTDEASELAAFAGVE